jgi:hypothetical protein
LDVGRQQTGGEAVELFENPRAPPVEINFFVEDDVDGREAEHRGAANRFHARHAQQRNGERIRDLVLHILRRAAHPFGEDDLLVFAQVGNGVHRDGPAFESGEAPVKRRDHHAPAEDEQHEEGDDEFLLQAEADEAVEHGVARGCGF